MERVLDRLWIGGADDLREALVSLGFSGVLDLRDAQAGLTLSPQERMYSLRLAHRDGEPWEQAKVHEALDFVRDRIQVGKVLVACSAGMSRSACMVIGYLVSTGWGVPEAYEVVRAARPRIRPVPRMLSSVLAALVPKESDKSDKKTRGRA